MILCRTLCLVTAAVSSHLAHVQQTEEQEPHTKHLQTSHSTRENSHFYIDWFVLLSTSKLQKTLKSVLQFSVTTKVSNPRHISMGVFVSVLLSLLQSLHATVNPRQNEWGIKSFLICPLVCEMLLISRAVKPLPPHSSVTGGQLLDEASSFQKNLPSEGNYLTAGHVTDSIVWLLFL